MAPPEYNQFLLLQREENKLLNSKVSSNNHLLDTVTTWWQDNDSVVTVNNCRQLRDYTTTGSSVTMLPAVIDGDYTIIV